MDHSWRGKEVARLSGYKVFSAGWDYYESQAIIKEQNMKREGKEGIMQGIGVVRGLHPRLAEYV
jgi:hypothetical protein